MRQGGTHTVVESLGEFLLLGDRQGLILLLCDALQLERSTYRDRAKVTEQAAAEVK